MTETPIIPLPIEDVSAPPIRERSAPVVATGAAGGVAFPRGFAGRRLRVLRCIASVNPVFGGPIEGIKQMAAPLANLGCDSEVLTLDQPEDAWARESLLPTHSLGSNAWGYRYSSALVPWLRQHHHNYDAILVHGLWNYCSLGVWRALRGTDTPYFVFPHGMLDPWFKRAHPLKHVKKRLYWPWADYRVLRDARAVLFTCEEERRLARQSFRLYRCHERVVNYGTSAPAGNANEQKQRFLGEFPELSGKRRMLFLGRLHEKKGCDLLIRAFGKISALASDLRLVMAGPCADARYLARLKRLASACCPPGAVTWTGMVAGDLKWGAIRAADVFALPSHQENFGIAVVEALACGVPTLISDKVNIWREIQMDGAGLVGTDDENGTFNILRRWFALSDAGRQAMRSNARCCFSTRFEIQRSAQSLLRVLTESIAASPDRDRRTARCTKDTFCDEPTHVGKG